MKKENELFNLNSYDHLYGWLYKRRRYIQYIR